MTENPRAARIRQCLRDLFEAASVLVSAPLGPQTIGPIPRIDPTASSGTFLKAATWRRTPDFNQSVQAAIHASPLLPKFIEQASADHVLEIHSQGPQMEPMPLRQFPAEVAASDLTPFYVAFLEEEGIEHYDDAAFERYWGRHSEEILNDRVYSVQLIGVDNIDTKGCTIRVGDSILVRPSFPKEINRWKQLGKEHWRTSLIRSTVEVLSLRKRAGARRVPNVFDEFELAFALLFAASAGITFSEEIVPSSGGSSGTYSTSDGQRYPMVVLTEEIAVRLAQLMEGVRQQRTGGAKGRRINLALRRYLQALKRQGLSDAYIDVWIALEALFGDRDAEIKLTLALRIVAFLTPRGYDAKGLFQQIKSWYSVRSDIVHGNLTTDPEEEPYKGSVSVLQSALTRVCDEPDAYPSELSLLEKSLL